MSHVLPKPTAASRDRHERDLIELTALPTAAGREDRVVAWVQRWVKRRKVVVTRDGYGNMLLSRAGAKPTKRPLVFTAHLDHPAFVVTEVDGKTLTAEFRGGVQDAYFVGTKVRWWPGDGEAKRNRKKGMPGRVTALRPADPNVPGSYKTATLTFARAPKAAVGDVVTWDVGGAVIRGGKLHAPACDDLAGLAAGLAAFGELLKQRGFVADVRFLCTRAEEVGFVGAIGAAQSGLLPPASRMVVLENSKASDHAPLGGGPVVRVGDYTSTFSPQLTAAVARAAQAVAAGDSGFQWQRKLMTGGTCEASAYLVFGYEATCVCLPLGNYHNMNEDQRKIAREYVAIDDFHGLVRLVMAMGQRAAEPEAIDPLRHRLDGLFASRGKLLEDNASSLSL